MDNLTPLLAVLVLIFGAIAFFATLAKKSATSELKAIRDNKSSNSESLLLLEAELKKNKEVLVKSQKKSSNLEKKLEEIRGMNLKKARKDGKKSKRLLEAEKNTTAVDYDEAARTEQKRLKKVILALEKQVEASAKAAALNSEEIRKEVELEFIQKLEKKEQRIVQTETKMNKLTQEIKSSSERKKEIAGSKLDLSKLDAPVLKELAFFYQKSVEFERLYGVSSSQLILEKEKSSELKKRYYSVCRELALAASMDGVDDAKAQAFAEKVIATTPAPAISVGALVNSTAKKTDSVGTA